MNIEDHLTHHTDMNFYGFGTLKKLLRIENFPKIYS